MGDLGFLSLTWVITFVPPLLAVWRFVRISRRVFRGVQFPRTFLAGAGLAFGLGGYTLLLAALAGFWGLVAVMAVSVLFAPSEAPSVIVPISLAEIPFLLAWLLSEPLIYVGCRAKRANAAAAA